MLDRLAQRLRRANSWDLATLAALLLFVLFLVLPLFSLVAGSFQAEGGRLTLQHYVRFFSKRFYYRTLLNSLTVASAVTVLAVGVGAPLAYLLNTRPVRGKALLETCIVVSLLSPPFIGAYSWILLLGRNGLLTTALARLGLAAPTIYGFRGILLAFTLKLFPFAYFYTSGALKKVDASLGEAAEGLGCGGLRKVLTVMFPLILPSLLAAGLLVFMNALADFGTPMLLGEGYQTMPVLIYNEFVGEVGGEANFAAAVSVVGVAFTTGLFALQKWVVSRRSYAMSSLRPIEPKPLRGPWGALAHALAYAVVALAVVPQCTVIWTSFRRTRGPVFTDGYSLDSYREVLSRHAESTVDTYLYGAAAIGIIVVLGTLISYVSVRRKNALTQVLDSLVMVPYIIPGSVLGITLLLAFNRGPLVLSGTAAILILAFVVRRLPYTVRSGAAILHQLSPSVEEAAVNLGCSPMQAFLRVTLAMMMPGVISGAILSWITVINELSASIILYTGSTKTMSVSVYTEVIRASYGTAAAFSTILTATTIVSLIAFFALTGRREIAV